MHVLYLINNDYLIIDVQLCSTNVRKENVGNLYPGDKVKKKACKFESFLISHLQS